MLKRTVILWLLLFLICSSQMNAATDDSQSVLINDINHCYDDFSVVQDEWNYPGMFSPVNAFDGDITTCYAASGLIFCTLIFENPVNIDEIRIINTCNDKSGRIKEFQRIKNLEVRIYSPGAQLEDTETFKEVHELGDVNTLQSVKLNQTYLLKSLQIGNNDRKTILDKKVTCISEIEFYYKCVKINILNDVAKLKKQYLDNIQKMLTDAFSDKVYGIYSELALMYTYKSGEIKYVDESLSNYGELPMDKINPVGWKVENSRLYMKFRNKWLLFKYTIYIPIRTINYYKKIKTVSLILYPRLYDHVSKDDPYRMYLRLPDDYQFEMLHGMSFSDYERVKDQ